jgi:predicted nucleotidyltransferase
MTPEILFEKVSSLPDFARAELLDSSKIALNVESVRTLQLIKQYIEKTCSVKQIILFGSRAQGNYTEDSDYDLMLITENYLLPAEKRKLSNKIIAELSRQKIDADIIVKNSEDIVQIYQKAFSIVKSAMETGMLI